MAYFKKLGLFAAPMALAAGSAGLMTGCNGEDGPLGDLAEQCGLTCPGDGEGVIAGNASISGVASVDAFFGSVVRLNTVTTQVTGSIRAELDAIALSVGLEKGAAAADIRGALEAKIAANVEGGLTIDYQAPKCEVSASATVEATAKCDASVDPGEVSASCSGSCEAEVSASGEVNCEAEATVECRGTAPDFRCEGACEGSCQLDAGASCEGTCKGGCDGDCSVENADGSCNGTCDGECTGSCELTAGASCEGECKGECTYTPPDAQCEAGASASCKADVEAEASVQCEGKCEGEVTPPSASAECEASAKAEAEVSAECTPPSLAVSFEFSGEVAGDASAEAEFLAWLEGFKGRFAALLAATAKADIVFEACADLGAAATGAVEGSVSAATKGDLDIKTSIGLGCALEQLPIAVELTTEASAELTTSIQAAAEITAVFGS